jgi:hypothetical protein
MSELRYPTWQEPVRLAVLEFNPEKKQIAVKVAFDAIEARQFELRRDSDHHEERIAMEDAIKILHLIRSEA